MGDQGSNTEETSKRENLRIVSCFKEFYEFKNIYAESEIVKVPKVDRCIMCENRRLKRNCLGVFSLSNVGFSPELNRIRNNFRVQALPFVSLLSKVRESLERETQTEKGINEDASPITSPNKSFNNASFL